jgi:hypothetical protein
MELDRKWRVVESRRGRLVVAVCESLKPRVDDESVAALGALAPTLLLAPVFSKPTDDSWWEHSASESWVARGTEVVVANSAVVAGWMTTRDGVQPVTCGAWRELPEPDGARWTQLRVEVDPRDGVVPDVAVPAPAASNGP